MRHYIWLEPYHAPLSLSSGEIIGTETAKVRTLDDPEAPWNTRNAARRSLEEQKKRKTVCNLDYRDDDFTI